MKRNLKLFLVSTTLLSFGLSHSACHSDANEVSRTKEFVKVEPDREMVDPEGGKSDIKLIKAGDIPYTVTRNIPQYSEEDLSDDQNDPTSNDAVYYDINFGKLTLDQFTTLQKAYSKNSALTYSSSRSYSLEDFMPAQIQALKGLRFNAEEVDTKVLASSKNGKEKPFILNAGSNCWNAAYEVVRNDSSKTYLYYVDGSVAESVLKDERYSSEVKTFSFQDWTSTSAFENRNAGLEPYDLILVYGIGSFGYGLQHVAVYLDKDFYFEKTGPHSLMNYRFAPFSDIAKTYAAFDEARVEVRRFKKAPLPPAPEVFTYKARGSALPGTILQSEQLLQAYPELPDFLTHIQHDTAIYMMVEAKMSLDPETQRYKLDPASFEKMLRGEALEW